MITVAVLGSGNIGHALAALLGSRPGVRAILWGRRWKRSRAAAITVGEARRVYAIGAVELEESLANALASADVAIIAVPTHARHRLLASAPTQLNKCALLVSWEGTGRFRESLQELGIEKPIAVGVQRSPILCRVVRRAGAVKVKGVRTSVVAATTNPALGGPAGDLLGELLPFRFRMAPTYECISVSPGNALIHPARMYSSDPSRLGRNGRKPRFYGDWDDAASEVLLTMHAEVARLRDALGLPRSFLHTLVDRRPMNTPSEITGQMQGAESLADIRLPLTAGPSGPALNLDHRYMREDIGEGLSYMLAIADRAEISMPTVQAVRAWYARVLAAAGAMET